MTIDAVEVTEPMDDARDHLLEQDKRQRAEAVIAAICEDAERLKRHEVDEAIRKLEARDDITDSQRDAVEAMAEGIVAHLLAVPTKNLREATAENDWSTIDTALRLFDPELGTDSGRGQASDADALEVASDDG
jgi:glutamyl-tRNA reductase